MIDYKWIRYLDKEGVDVNPNLKWIEIAKYDLPKRKDTGKLYAFANPAKETYTVHVWNIHKKTLAKWFTHYLELPSLPEILPEIDFI